MDIPKTRAHVVLTKIFAVIVILIGLPLVVGGVILGTSGGSWYYAPTGLALIVSGLMLFKDKLIGAHIFGLFFIATIAWTIYETGSRFWGWVPRLALFAVLAFFLTLLLPYIGQGVRKKIAYTLTSIIAVCFAVALVGA